MAGSSSRKVRTALGWLVSLAVVAFIVRVVEWREVVGELREVRYLLLVPLTLVAGIHFSLRSWRWRYLLPGGRDLRFRVLNDALMLGNMANYLLPLRAGELIRPALLARRTQHGFSVALVSVVIERFFDLTAVLAMFAILIAFVPGVPALAYGAVYAFSLLALALLGFILVGGLRPRWVTGACRALLRPLPRGPRESGLAFVAHLLEGAAVLRSGSNLVMTTLLTLAVWLSCYAYFLLSLWMFAVPSAGWPALAVVVMVALAVAFPSAPGFIGVFQAGCMLGLGLFGISEELGVAYSLIVHVHTFLYICGVGLLILLGGHLSLRKLRDAGAREDDAA